MGGDHASAATGSLLSANRPAGCKRRSVTKTERVFAYPNLIVLAWGTLLAVGVCWPMLGGRPLFLLDWVSGPRGAWPPSGALGLQGGLTAGVVPGVLIAGGIRLFGEAVTWLVLFCVFPIAAVGAGRLTGGRTAARIAAATLYCVNPWVFNRIFAGQLTLLLGYALLPFAVRSALDAPKRRSWSMLGAALWWVVLAALSPHYAWIYGLVLLAAAVVARPRTWRSAGRIVGWLVACGAAFVVMDLYILLPYTATQLRTTVGSIDLLLYRTTGDPRLGLFPNVLGLYGFWRIGPGPEMAKDVVTGWPLFLLALLIVVVVGFWWVLRGRGSGEGRGGPSAARGLHVRAVPPAEHADRRRLAWLLVIVGMAGYFLALGDQGPTGPLYRWAYDTVPFFAVMREAQKWLMLTALAYAVGFGWGVECLARRRRPAPVHDQPPDPVTPAAADAEPVVDDPPGQLGGVGSGSGRFRWRPAWTACMLGMILPLAYTPTIFDGLAGQIGPSTIPAAYTQANDLIGHGPGEVLYLPWHLYEAQPFTGGRVVANPGSSLFSRPVISGDDVQLDGVYTQSTLKRSAYLQQLYDAGPSLSDLGARLAPLGVAYVVLAKTVNWRSYSWLGHQRDLRLVLDDRTLEVWRNTAYDGVGLRTGTAAAVRQVSPVAYRIPPGPPGTATIDAPYQPGWVLDGHEGHPTAQGATEFHLGTHQGGVARFTPWGLLRLGYIVSGATFAALATLVVTDGQRRRHLCRRRHRQVRPGPPAS